jgi:hypothetical protein
VIRRGSISRARSWSRRALAASVMHYGVADGRRAGDEAAVFITP